MLNSKSMVVVKKCRIILCVTLIYRNKVNKAYKTTKIRNMGNKEFELVITDNPLVTEKRYRYILKKIDLITQSKQEFKIKLTKSAISSVKGEEQESENNFVEQYDLNFTYYLNLLLFDNLREIRVHGLTYALFTGFYESLLRIGQLKLLPNLKKILLGNNTDTKLIPKYGSNMTRFVEIFAYFVHCDVRIFNYLAVSLHLSKRHLDFCFCFFAKIQKEKNILSSNFSFTISRLHCSIMGAIVERHALQTKYFGKRQQGKIYLETDVTKTQLIFLKNLFLRKFNS